MGAFLHDIGKMAVPLEVMNKATRLNGKEKEIEARLNMFKLRAKIMMLEKTKDTSWYEDFEEKVGQALKVVQNANTAGFLNDNLREEMEKVFSYELLGEPFFTEDEKHCLSIVKGTLTEEERKIMESHVVITDHILSKVHFNKSFKNAPVFAAQHHECLNGKGYPKGLKADEIPTESRIMAVADICDALLATDRPYKKPLPREKAFEIMRDMANEGRIERKYVEYLYNCIDQ